jgi:hypothetical protein
MNESETIEELALSGRHIYRIFPRWKVFARKSRTGYQNFLGLDFVTVFSNGRTAAGHINP